MLRTQQLSRIVLRSVLTQLDLTAESHAGAVYIGLGDRFDDDRRLVRDTASTLRADPSRLGWSLRVLRA